MFYTPLYTIPIIACGLDSEMVKDSKPAETPSGVSGEEKIKELQTLVIGNCIRLSLKWRHQRSVGGHRPYMLVDDYQFFFNVINCL